MRQRRLSTQSDPLKEFSSFEHFVCSGAVPTGRFSIAHKGVPVDFSYSPVEGAKTTVICFHPAAGGSVHLPWLAGKRVMEGIRANRLAISDPSLTLDETENLTLAWFAGSSTQPDLQGRMESVIRRVQELTGIENLVFFGASGGGFAALEQSRRFPNSVALVLNPQTSIGNYYQASVRRYLNLSWDGAGSLSDVSELSTHDLVAEYPTVLSHTVAYVQNTRDDFHIKNHQIPFFEKIGDNPKALMLMDSWGDPEGSGHVAPPSELIRSIIMELVVANGSWRKALVDSGFAHQTTPATISRQVKLKQSSPPAPTDASKYEKSSKGTSMNKPLITEQQREEADDAGFAICEECGTSYMPAPGFMNDGHQCNENGLEDRFILPES